MNKALLSSPASSGSQNFIRGVITPYPSFNFSSRKLINYLLLMSPEVQFHEAVELDSQLGMWQLFAEACPENLDGIFKGVI